MVLNCSTCSKSIGTSQTHITCSKCLKNYHATCVNLTTNELNYFTEGNNKWVCSVCCKQGRVTRSNSASSSSGPRSDTPSASPQAEPATPSDPLALILCQLSTMANDIRDIKNSQTQLSADVAHCRTLLQQHSDTIARHHDSIISCEASIQQLQNTQASLSCTIANIESRLASSMSNAEISADSATNNTSTQAEALEILRRSHHIILRGIPEDNNDTNTVIDIINHIDPSANSYRLSVARLGAATTSRPRLIRVGFASPVIAKAILRRKNSILSHPVYKSIKISDDKTPSQMRELQNLRDELKRRLTTGERNITIKYVRGRPSIIQITAQESNMSKNP
nr:unnamed protein product [Callosobruchus chinensis]